MAFFKKVGTVIVILLGLALGAWVVLDNPEPVQMVLLGFHVSSIPAGIWLLLSILVGFLLGVFANFPASFKQKSQIKYLQGQLVKARQKATTYAP